MRKLLFRITVVVVVWAAVENEQRLSEVLPQPLIDDLPPAVVKETQNVTVGDVLAIKGVLARWPEIHSFDDLQNAFDAESPQLHYLVVNLIEFFHEKVGDKVDGLNNNTKTFLASIGATLKGSTEQVKQLYNNQPDEVKDDLRKSFPSIMLFLENPGLKSAVVSYMCGKKSPGLILNGSSSYRGAFGMRRFGHGNSFYSNFRRSQT